MRVEELKPGMLVYAATCGMEGVPLNGTHEDVEATINVVEYTPINVHGKIGLALTHCDDYGGGYCVVDVSRVPILWMTPEEAKRNAVERMRAECENDRVLNERRVALLDAWLEKHTGQ